nr:transporter substrate-binding domain-containing protein [Clostridium sp. MF28]
MSKEENFEYELKPMDFNGIIPGLTANQLDGAIAAITITDERKQTLDFSDGYFVSGLSIVTNKITLQLMESMIKWKKCFNKKGNSRSKIC